MYVEISSKYDINICFVILTSALFLSEESEFLGVPLFVSHQQRVNVDDQSMHSPQLCLDLQPAAYWEFMVISWHEITRFLSISRETAETHTWTMTFHDRLGTRGVGIMWWQIAGAEPIPFSSRGVPITFESDTLGSPGMSSNQMGQPYQPANWQYQRVSSPFLLLNGS